MNDEDKKEIKDILIVWTVTATAIGLAAWLEHDIYLWLEPLLAI